MLSDQTLKWVLGLCAVTARLEPGNRIPAALAGTLDRKDAAGISARAHELRTEAQALARLKWRCSPRRQTDFDEIQAIAARRPPPARTVGTKHPDPTLDGRLELAWATEGKVSSACVLAWDAGALVAEAAVARAAGLISDAQAWNAVLEIAGRIQVAFSSWNDFAEAYSVGVWHDRGYRVTEVERAVRALLDDPSSPWRTTDWATPLELPSAIPPAVKRTERKSVEIGLVLDCEACAMPIPLDGVRDRAECATCGEVHQLDASWWKGRLAKKVAAVLAGSSSGGSTDIAYGLSIECNLEPPRCTSCFTLVDLGAVAAAAPLGFCVCTACGSEIGARVADDRARAVVEGALWLVGEGRATRDEIAAEPLPCSSCGGLVLIDGTQRIVGCPRCKTRAYIADVVWRRFHPVRRRTLFYVITDREQHDDGG
jgi:hypothetical protein